MRELKHILFLSALVLVVFEGCKKTESQPIDLGYDYFPNKERSYIIYQIDSTVYGLEELHYHFQLKELLAEAFVDEQGDEAMRVERYTRANGASAWNKIGELVQKRTTTTAERVEGNNRFIKLAFPFRSGKTWKGNAYNTLGDWNYRTDNFDVPADLGVLEFPKTSKVTARENINLVQNQVSYEIYARNTGLIFRKYTDLNIQTQQTTGIDVTWKAIAIGTE